MPPIAISGIPARAASASTPNPQRRAVAALRGRVVDRPEHRKRDAVVGSRAQRRDLRGGVGRYADREARCDTRDVVGGQRRPGQLHAVGAHRQRDVDAIVDVERDARGGRDGAQRARELGERSPGQILFPQLHGDVGRANAAAGDAPQRGGDHLGQRAIASRVAVGDQQQARGAGRSARGAALSS